MNASSSAENLRIDAPPMAILSRSITACRAEPAYEVRLQHVRWQAAGSARVTAGSRCVLELLLPLGLAEGQTHYAALAKGGGSRPVGRLNFVVPDSELVLAWSGGEVRSIVCMFDPARLGLLGGMGWEWNDVDPMAALDVRNERLEAAMRWLLEELLCPSFASELQLQSLLTMLALETRRHFGAGSTSDAVAPGKLGSKQLALIKDMVAQPGADGVSLHKMGAALGLPARELTIRFKNTQGMTLRSYVAGVHIETAKLLLADQSLMIKQVAWRSGFDSAAAFSAAFRKATGITPLRYREQRCGAASARLE